MPKLKSIMLGRANKYAQAVERLEQMWWDSMALAAECGALISHHHGAGRARAPSLDAQLGTGYTTIEAVGQALGPRDLVHLGSLVRGKPALEVVP